MSSSQYLSLDSSRIRYFTHTNEIKLYELHGSNQVNRLVELGYNLQTILGKGLFKYFVLFDKVIMAIRMNLIIGPQWVSSMYSR